jgi:hypothetical protein
VSLFCQQVLAAGGDYLLTVKANQATLHRALMRVFEPGARPLLHRQEYRTSNQGHGRIEVRHLIAQVFRVERTWRHTGKEHQQVRYGIS